jgi:hypothetical protein
MSALLSGDASPHSKAASPKLSYPTTKSTNHTELGDPQISADFLIRKAGTEDKGFPR